MKNNGSYEKGIALIISMIILAVMTILVVNSVRNSTLGEKMSGGYMDRGHAQLAAEQALRQGEALLLANAAVCVSGCQVAAGAGAVTPSTATRTLAQATADNSAWDAAHAVTVTLQPGNTVLFRVQLLPSAGPDSVLPMPPGALVSPKDGCAPYSIVGRGVGLDARTAVVLQTIAYVCPV